MEGGLSQDFVGFIVLLVISVVVSGILHYGLRFYAVPGTASFLSKIVVGYIGGWLAGPVFGTWFFTVGGVDVIAAIVGSVALLVVAIDVANMVKRTQSPQQPQS